MVFLPDSKRILVAGSDGTAIVDIASGARSIRSMTPYPPIAVSPDGKTLAAATDQGDAVIIGLFDLDDRRRAPRCWPGIADESFAWPSAPTEASWHQEATTTW